MKKLNSFIIKLRYIVNSIKKMRHPKLGDIVFYNEEKCILIQGVNNPYWNLMPVSEENLNKEKRDIYKNIHSSKFKIRKSVSRNYWAFKSSYKFKMTNWYKIDMHQMRSKM